MIERIDLLHDIGGFSHFTWGEGVPSFSKVNLIFGDNGSGKTAISNALRLFSTQPGADDIFGELPSGPSPTVQATFDGQQVTYSPTCPRQNMYVFNADFVAEHVFDGSAITCKPFDESVVTRDQLSNPQLKDLEKRLAALTKKKDEKGATKARLEKEFDDLKKTLSAKFNARVKGSRMPTMASIPDTAPSESTEGLRSKLDAAYDEYDCATKQAQIRADCQTLTGLAFNALPSDLPNRMSNALSVSVPQDARRKVQQKINALGKCDLKHASIGEWLEDGYLLLKDKRDKAKTSCPLCDSDLTATLSGLIKDYESFFSEEYGNLMANVNGLGSEIAEAIVQADEAVLSAETLNGIEQRYMRLWTDHEAADALVDAARSMAEEVRGCVDGVKGQLEKWQCELAEKKENIAKTTWPAPSDAKANLEAYNRAIARLQKRRDEIHDRLASGIREPNDVLNEIKDLCVKFVHTDFDTQGEGNQIAEYAALTRDIPSLDGDIARLQAERNREVAALRSESKHVNDYLKRLGIAHFEIMMPEPKSDEGIRVAFENGHTRSRLRYSVSESEKTTLALAYFLSKIQYEVFEDERHDIGQAAVVIDDPVSSLDENRLHTTALLIWRMFEGCEQLIVLSHNLIFLRFLSNVIGSANGKDAEGKPYRRDYYLPRCATRLEKLPKDLRYYQTTYFHRLIALERYERGEKGYEYENVKMFIPAYVRTVLETFLSFKLCVLRDKDKYQAAGLRKLIGRLGSQKGLFKDYIPVGDINHETLVDALERIKRITDPQCHGSPQQIDQASYVSESELDKAVRDALDAIRFLSRIHVDWALRSLPPREASPGP